VAKGLVGMLRQAEGSVMSGKGMALAALEPAWSRWGARNEGRGRLAGGRAGEQAGGGSVMGPHTLPLMMTLRLAAAPLLPLLQV
jgi:hypothetical protein